MELTAKKLTPEELDSVLRRKDLAACRDFFLGATEKERKVVAARALEWYEVATAFEAVGGPFMRAMLGFESELPKRMQQQLATTKKVEKGELLIPAEVKDKESVVVSRLAVTACASLTDIRKCGMAPPEFAFEVMRDRKPKWMGKWLNFACEHGWSSWLIVRAIEKHGIAVAEQADEYWNSMAYTLGQKDVVDLAEYIKQDSELRDSLLWGMLNNDAAIKLISDPSSVNDQFRVNARNFNGNDWNQMGIRLDDAKRASFNWRLILIELANKGEIDRSRLLEYTFEWLARLSGDRDSRPTASFASNTSPTEWFQQLHDELNLSADERNAQVLRYIGLLSVRDVATLTWSVKALSSCSRNVLPLDDLVANLPRVFYHKRKEPALAALQFVDQLYKENSELLMACTDLVIEAFEHSNSEVQKKALSFLKRTKALSNPSVAAQLEPKLERLSALMRKEVTDLLRVQRAISGSVETVPRDSDSESDDSVSGDDFGTENVRVLPFAKKSLAEDTQQAVSTREELLALIQEVSHLKGELAVAAGIPAAIEAAKESRVPPALTLKSMEIPRLDESKRIQPVETLDELIFLFLHVVERSASTDDGERLMDGVSRLHHLHPPEFDAMVSSLKRKLEQSLNAVETLGDNAMVPYYVKLAHAWLKARAPKAGFAIIQELKNAFSEALFSPVFGTGVVASNAFLHERAAAITRTIKRGCPFPLLAAPTHAGGWIDPLAIPERLAVWEKRNVIPENADLIQALLRLAPEHRTDALNLIPPHKAEHIRAIRWALGAEMNGDAQTPALWVAALRCREPEGNSSYLANRFRLLGPDSAHAATYVDQTEEYAKRQNSIYGINFTQPSQSNLPISVLPEVKNRGELRMFPTELLHVNSVFFEAEPMMELYYPLHRESFFANQANRTAMFLTSSGTYWASEWNALFDSDNGLTGMGTWMLVISLSAKQSEAARLAIDATIAGIEETRLDGEKFGFVMARFFRTGFITLTRWMTAFKDISRISPLHTEFCFQALENCLANIGDEYKAKPPVPMIECLYDSAQSAKSRINNRACRAFLEGIQSKGKAAKLAKLLLELDDKRRNEHVDEVNLQILQSRMDRIERWKKRLNKP